MFGDPYARIHNEEFCPAFCDADAVKRPSVELRGRVPAIHKERTDVFLLTLEPTQLPWSPPEPLPTHAPSDALVPVTTFFRARPTSLTYVLPILPFMLKWSLAGPVFPDVVWLPHRTWRCGCIPGEKALKPWQIFLSPSQPGLRLTRVQFPQVVCVGVQPVDHLLTAYAWGDDILDPITQIPRYCGRARSHNPLTYLDHGENEMIYVYPAAMSMQYMVLYNANRSTYLASYSTGEETLSFNVRVSTPETLTLSVNHYPFVSSGEWISPECAQAALEGGWLPAADLYASRMRKRMPQAEHSSWLQRSFDGWLMLGMHFEGKAPLYRFTDLPDIFRESQASGINTLHIYGWSGNGHDTLYPDYDVDRRWAVLRTCAGPSTRSKPGAGAASYTPTAAWSTLLHLSTKPEGRRFFAGSVTAHPILKITAPQLPLRWPARPVQATVTILPAR